MATAVLIAEKDPTMVQVLTGVCQAAGLDVLAACDHSNDLINLVRRFGADVVVTERSLVDGPVDPHLGEIRAAAPDATIIVFTAYVPDEVALEAMGVVRVVRKPDFEDLGHALEGVRSAKRAAQTWGERRLPRRIVEPHPARWRSPSGVEPADALEDRLALVAGGDTVVTASFDDTEALAMRHGDRARVHCEIELGRTISRAVRPEDLVVELHDGTYVVLLLGGDDRAARAVAERVNRSWNDQGMPGKVRIGSAVRTGDESAYLTMSRAQELTVLT